MKRLTTLTLALIAIAVGAWAQNNSNHFALSHVGEGAKGGVSVEAKLVLGTLANEPNWQNMEVAAFVGDEVRAVTFGTLSPAVATHADYNYFPLYVKGNYDIEGKADEGKAITFKLYDHQMGIEYDLTPQQAITFADGETHGTLSALFELSATPLQDMSLPVFYQMEVGQTIDLRAALVVTPTGATLPNNIEWSVGTNTNFLSVTADGKLTATSPNTGGMVVSATVGNLEATTSVVVTQRATSITVNPSEVTVNLGEELTGYLTKYAHLSPETSTDEVLWECETNGVVAYEASNAQWKAVGTGTAIMTAYAAYIDSDGAPVKRTDVAPATLTVTVVEHLVSIVSSHDIVECLPGDNLSAVIDKLYTLNPATTTETDVTFAIGGGEEGVLTMSGGNIVAAKPGRAVITVTSAINPNIVGSIAVSVRNAATGLSFAQPTVTVTYPYDNGSGARYDITDAIKANIAFTPAGSDALTVNNALTVGCDNSLGVAAVYDGQDGYGLQSFVVNGVGTANVTVQFRVPDYLQNTLNPETAVYRTVEGQFALEVKQGVTGLQLPAQITVGKGGTVNLLDYLTVLPAGAEFDATLLKWDAANSAYYVSITDNVLTALNVNEQGAWIGVSYPSLLAGAAISASTSIVIVNRAERIIVNTPVINVNVGDSESLNDQLAKAVSLDPADATDKIVWSSDDESIVAPLMTTVGWNPVGKGQTTMHARVLDTDGSARLEAQVTVNVAVVLKGFTVRFGVEPLAVGVDAQMVLTPDPTDADYELNQLSVSARADEQPEGFTFVSATKAKNADNTVTVTLLPASPGSGFYELSYDVDGQQLWGKEDAMTVGVPLTLSTGWQWKTLWGTKGLETSQLFPNNEADEVRSQDELMALDDSYGYFGSLVGNLQPNVAYKIKANMDVPAVDAPIQLAGTYVAEPGLEQPLLQAWTWIGYPYCFSHNLNVIGLKGVDGDRIVSKDNGFAEYKDGAWKGTLNALEPWLAYLYYNNGDAAERTIVWQAEAGLMNAGVALPDQDENGQTEPVGPIASRRKTALHQQRTWQYDASRFRDNMSMVALVEGVAIDGRHTIGAFVGDECRGEGVCIDGCMFITVHANSGEQVTFRLHDSLTGETFDIDQTVTSRMAVGTMASPFRMTSSAAVTGISTVGRDAVATESYDLNGRRLDTRHTGVTVQRMADGTFRKVVVK